MGCGSSAAVSSASKVNAVTLRTKDAGSQTNVTVLVSSTASDARTEAHDARKELIMQHRSQALAKARELSNSKSGYTTATYTGSGMSTPRSGYSRTHKFRGSDIGSGSDGELKSRLNLSSYDMNNSLTNLSERSGHSARKTQVSFRNDQYNRLVSTSYQKRRKTITNSNQNPQTNKPLRKNRRSSRAESNHSESSGTNSMNKQADTGYDGSVSSGPSTVAIAVRKSVTTSDYSSTSNVNIASKQSDSTPLITQTFSNETDPGRLSVVVSVDEQSVAPDTLLDERRATEDPSDPVTDEVSGKLSPVDSGDTADSGEAEVMDKANHEVVQSDAADELKNSAEITDNQVDSSSENGKLLLESNGNNANVVSEVSDNVSFPQPLDEKEKEPDNVKSNLIIVSTPPLLTKSDSRASIKQIVSLESSMKLNSDAITALE